MRRMRTMIPAALLVLGVSAGTGSAQVCVGTCGTLGANGVVTAPPVGTGYRYVTTTGSEADVALVGVGGTGFPVNGSRYTTAAFSANSGDMLDFYFNYVTSDGAGFADYAWARLLNADLSEAALLFTARTRTSGSIVPGQDMPDPDASLTPPSVEISEGTTWSPLGEWSGLCFDVGCGHTGWIFSQYTIGTAGSFFLEFGVTNWNDRFFDSGLAFAGAQVAGVIIDPTDPTVIPEPASMALFATGLAGLAFVRMRRTRPTKQG